LDHPVQSVHVTVVQNLINIRQSAAELWPFVWKSKWRLSPSCLSFLFNIMA